MQFSQKEQEKLNHIKAIQKTNIMGKLPLSLSVYIVPNTDLRSLSHKIEYVDGAVMHGWFCFVNKAGKLAHIMHSDDTYSYNRMRIPVSLKGCSENFMLRYFYHRMVGRYVI